jgi:AGZA family xanthine/uracil permease-like MFS transporter
LARYSHDTPMRVIAFRLRTVLAHYFRVDERGSTVPREVRGGLVTFVTMAYIGVLNPLIIGSFAANAPTAKRDVLGRACRCGPS